MLAEMATGNRRSTDGLTGTFAHIVERCLADDPDDRWQSARDIGMGLEWAGQSATVATGVFSLRKPSPPTSVRTA
jgi:hypothetical protein